MQDNYSSPESNSVLLTTSLASSSTSRIHDGERQSLLGRSASSETEFPAPSESSSESELESFWKHSGGCRAYFFVTGTAIFLATIFVVLVRKDGTNWSSSPGLGTLRDFYKDVFFGANLVDYSKGGDEYDYDDVRSQ